MREFAQTGNVSEIQGPKEDAVSDWKRLQDAGSKGRSKQRRVRTSSRISKDARLDVAIPRGHRHRFNLYSSVQKGWPQQISIQQLNIRNKCQGRPQLVAKSSCFSPSNTCFTQVIRAGVEHSRVDAG